MSTTRPISTFATPSLAARLFRALVAALSLLPMATSVAGATIPTNASVTTYQVGSGPYSVVIGDFDRDGNDDLAVANGSSGTVSILLGTGAGRFATAVAYPSGPPGFYSSYLATDDFNADGRLDLALGSGALLLGNGDGTFSAGPDHAIVGGPLLAGDFDGDGRADLAVTIFRIEGLSRINAISLLLGKGDGSFQTAIETENICCAAGGGFLTSADFNRDGWLDLALSQSTRGSFLAVLLGHGDGSFDKSELRPANGSYGVASGDFNRDEAPDLAIAAGYINAVSVQLGIGDGSFGPEVYYAASLERPAPVSGVGVVTGDFDGDGIEDLAMGIALGLVSTLYGLGDGTFIRGVEQPVGSFAAFLASADLDGNGLDDLAVSSGPDTIAVLLSQPIDAASAVSALGDDLASMGLSRGLTASLLAQLDRAFAELSAGDEARACTHLENFIRALGIHSGAKLSDEQATQLMSPAQWIRGHVCG